MIYHQMNVRSIFIVFEYKQISLILDSHIIFRVNFNNFMASTVEKRLMEGPNLPDVTSATFFKVRKYILHSYICKGICKKE